MLPPHPELPPWTWLLFRVLGFAIRIIALDIAPKHRRTFTSTTWLLLISLRSLLGAPLYVILDLWWAMGRWFDGNPEARQLASAIVVGSTVPNPENYEVPDWPDGLLVGSDDDTASIVRLPGALSGFPASVGWTGHLYNDAAEIFRTMAASIDATTHHVNALYYQASRDKYTTPFYEALERAVACGVTVRLLVDHHGMCTVPGHKDFRRRLNTMGIEWHEMLPFAPLHEQVRHPDLCNHCKTFVIGGREAHVNSHDLMALDYDTPSYTRSGMLYDDTSVPVTGSIVAQIQVILVVD